MLTQSPDIVFGGEPMRPRLKSSDHSMRDVVALDASPSRPWPELAPGGGAERVCLDPDQAGAVVPEARREMFVVGDGRRARLDQLATPHREIAAAKAGVGGIGREARQQAARDCRR